MMMKDAIAEAPSEHVVYFLLTAYVETLHFYEATRSIFQARVARLPLAGPSDVEARLCALDAMLEPEENVAPALTLVTEEARDMFDAARRRLHELEPGTEEGARCCGGMPSRGIVTIFAGELPLVELFRNAGAGDNGAAHSLLPGRADGVFLALD